MDDRSRRGRARGRDWRRRRPEPPGVMWPDEGSGFEASPYSPAGQLQQEAQIIENVGEDPVGVWRALRASWGTRIIVGGIAVIAVIASLNALLHL